MALLQVSAILIDEALFHGVAAHIVGVVAYDPQAGVVTFRIEGGDVPDCEEVTCTLTIHEPVTVQFEKL